ncbi:MAG: hypothetical protein A2X36_14790 [Elusimicrobia bacterium GWA2_69_24]|nr:MAG: hypothetical protein A2X36_14790 [Elusimicrobia bacterium GWA2_69_24]HBL16838.1 hypothetical protein [Elusimicrobiota bacterium]
MASAGGSEIELKLGLPTREDWHLLLRRLAPPAETRVQENLFFEGPGGELRRLGASLRVRRERVFRAKAWPREALFLTLKHGEQAKDGVFARSEIECPLDPVDGRELTADPHALLGLDLEPVRALRGLAPGLRRLKPIGSFTNFRCVFEVALEGRRTVWEVDRTDFPRGRVEYELEIEFPKIESAERARGHAAAKLEALGVRFQQQPLSKLRRFLQYSHD